MAKNKKKVFAETVLCALTILFGVALYALGFDLFWKPQDLNGGGTSGLSLLIVHVTGFGTVGLINFLLNVPLFIADRAKLGRRFFWGSVIGMTGISFFFDLFDRIPKPAIDEPLLGVVYGALICGVGIGILFKAGASGGGSDILIRLIKMRYQNASAGQIGLILDGIVIVLTAIVFQDIQKALYSGIAIFIYSKVFDAVLYSFDYSRVALIISPKHEEIAQAVVNEMHRGVTLLEGEGFYSHNHTKVIMTAIRNKQLADLKRLVVEVDPNAFVIIQDSHQILGEGFARYSKTGL